MLYDIKRKKGKIPIFGMLFVIIVLFLAFYPILCFSGAFEPPMTPGIARRDFNKYEEHFLCVSRYMSDNDIRDLYIYGAEDIKLPDEDVCIALQALIKAGYSRIGIEKNTLFFQKHATLDCGKGILYSLDGAPPYLQFLTDTKALDAENWYYYEDDYNEWRVRHRKNSEE